MAFLHARWLARHGAALFGLVLAALAWASLQSFIPGLLYQAEERAGDFIWRMNARTDAEHRIVVVDVDERSLEQIGPWPWPRATLAQLLERLHDAGAGEQIFDIVFSENRPDDEKLAAAVAHVQPVLAQVFALEQGARTSAGQLAGALAWAGCPAPFGEAVGYLGNIAALRAPHAGHITPRVASDGVVRHQPAIICHDGKAYPALGIAALLQAAGVQSLQLQRGESWWGAAWSLQAPELSAAIPLDERGDLRVSWRQHPDSFISLSAADVLAGRAPRELLNNAWVLLGSSAFGLNDSIATPYGGVSTGLQAHLQIMTALLDGRTPHTPRVQTLVQTLAALLGVGLLLLVRHRPRAADRALGAGTSRHFPVYLLPLVASGWVVCLLGLHALLLTRFAIWVGWLSPSLFIVFAGSSIGILEHARSRLDRNQLYTHLSSYLPAAVASALVNQSPSSVIHASTQQVSVLFADIRNFSAYCENRPPEEAAAVLHAFFSTATRVIERHGGVIESFQGDAVIAVWNGVPRIRPAPDVSASSDAQHALDAAVELLAAMKGVLPDLSPQGLEPLSLGIGVESGLAMAGSFGLARRRTHMVMGRTVTIASRLVGMTAELSHPILAGEGLAGQIGGVALESMGIFLLDGLRVPHHIYAYPLSADTPY